MSDYLAHLAARSLGLLPLAQPRLASLFEPRAAGAAPADRMEQQYLESLAAPALPPADRPMRTRIEEPQLPVRVRSAEEPRRQVARETQRPSDAAMHVRERTRDRTDPPAMPIAVAPRPVHPSAPASRMVNEPRPSATPSGILLNRLTVVAPDRRSDEPHLPAAGDVERWRAADARLSALERGQNSAHNRTARVEPKAENVAAAVDRVPSTHANTQPSSAIRLSDSTLQRETPGAVHVTIGRVDVRAIMPAAPARPAPRPAAPRVSPSLDDYLKQRSSR